MDNSMIETPRLSANALKQIDLFLEAFYPQAQTAGSELAHCKMKTTQVRGLENIIVATTRFSEIINYIKNQAGKEKKDNVWRNAAPLLLTQFEELEQQAAAIAGDDPARRLEVKLRLARGWARQVVAHYLYQSQEKGGQE